MSPDLRREELNGGWIASDLLKCIWCVSASDYITPIGSGSLFAIFGPIFSVYTRHYAKISAQRGNVLHASILCVCASFALFVRHDRARKEAMIPVSPRKPTIREALQSSIAEAIAQANMQDRKNTVRSWLMRNRWPLDDLLRFAVANDLATDLNTLASSYDFEVLQQDQHRLRETVSRTHPVLDDLFRQIQSDGIADYRNDPATQFCGGADQVALYVQSNSGYIAERDEQLQDHLLASLRKGVSICYLVPAQSDAAFSSAPLPPLAAAIRDAFDYRTAGLADRDQLLERVFCVRTAPGVSISALFARCVIVAALPGGATLARNAWPPGLSVLQILIGVATTARPSTTTDDVQWSIVHKTSGFGIEFHREHRYKVFPPKGEADARPISELLAHNHRSQ